MRKIKVMTPLGKKIAYINPINVVCLFSGAEPGGILPIVLVQVGMAPVLQMDYSSVEEAYAAIFEEKNESTLSASN